MNSEPRATRLEQNLGYIILLLLLIGAFIVVQPFVSAIMWAVVLCFTLWPLHRRLTARLRNRRTLSALLMTLSITLVLVVPVVTIGFSLADDVRALATATRKWVHNGPPAAPPWLDNIPLIGAQAKAWWTEAGAESAAWLDQLGQGSDPATRPASTRPTTRLANSDPSKLSQAVRATLLAARSIVFTLGVAIGQGTIQVILSVFLTFFLLRDGAAVAERLVTGMTRIAGPRGAHLLTVAGNTIRGVVYGILGTALAQGVVAGIGFAIAGVPGAALLGLFTALLSPLPVGPPLIWIPATIWLFHEGFTGWSIFMLIWGMGVSSLDNVVKPWLISQGSDMPFILIFIGVIGGALAFGFIGVFLGPTLLAVAYRLLEEWSATAPAKPLADAPAEGPRV